MARLGGVVGLAGAALATDFMIVVVVLVRRKQHRLQQEVDKALAACEPIAA